jgi:hypothetical protein
MNGSAVFDLLDYAPMRLQDVDAVLAIEQSVFPHPWSRGNFVDSLTSGYDAWVLRDEQGQLAGYFLLMAAVDGRICLTSQWRPAARARAWAAICSTRWRRVRAGSAPHRYCWKCARRTCVRWPCTGAMATLKLAGAVRIIRRMKAGAKMRS